jgi:hypothetical protein
MNEEFIEEIDERINTNFKVTRIPVSVLKEFKLFCKSECGDIYWVGINRLLQIKKEKEEIFTLLRNLQNQIDQIKLNSKKEVKTFK